MLSWCRKYRGWTVEIIPDEPNWWRVNIHGPDGYMLRNSTLISAATRRGALARAKRVISKYLAKQNNPSKAKTYNL